MALAKDYVSELLNYDPDTGTFKNKFDAHNAYLKAAKEVFGEFARS